MQAALTTASLHTMVHASVRAGASVIELMRNLNAHLCETLPDASFVTMACLAIDLESGAVECVNSGHLPALVVDDAGNVRHLQESANLPLGIADEPLESQTDQVNTGEWIGLYSDGLTELSYESGGMLGVEGLTQHFREACLQAGNGDGAAARVTQTVTDTANEIRGQRMADDDWTFLVARRL